MSVNASPSAFPVPRGPGARNPASRWWVLAAVECGNFVVYMDGFIVTLALPAMARHFGVGIHEIKWAVVAYLAAVTVTLLLAGRLADIWGRRLVTITGMTLHTLSAVLCALAPTMTALLVFRVLQGLGGALMLANVMAEISAVFPREERRVAMGVNVAVLAMAQVTGLIVGGLLTGWWGWRSVFLVPIVVGVVGLGLDLAVLGRQDRDRRTVHMDWGGAILSILVVGTPFFVLERLAADPTSPSGLGLVLAGAVLLWLFVVVERRSRHPLLDLGLFRSKGYVCGAVAASCYFMAATSAYFLLPLYAQIVRGLSPLSAGLIMLPVSLALTVTSQLTPRLGKGISARTLCTAGLACAAVGALALSPLGHATSFWLMLWPLLLLGMGGGIFHPPNNTAVLSDVAPEELGVANGFFTTARNFGQAIGTSIAAEILARHLHSAVEGPHAPLPSVGAPAY